MSSAVQNQRVAPRERSVIEVWPILVALGALVIRLLIIWKFPFLRHRPTFDGGGDLAYYYYYADLMLKGLNPWNPPQGPPGISGLDIPPLEMLLFAGVLSLYRHPLALRLTFALADAISVYLIASAFPRARKWRVVASTFAAFNPFVLISWTAFSEDKTLHFLALTVILLFVERGHPARAWITAMIYAAAKWVSLLFMPPLFLHIARLRVRRLWLYAVGGAAILAIAQIPYFPSPLVSYLRRNNRLDAVPEHASVTKALESLHLYGPWLPRSFIVFTLLAIYYFYWRNRLTIQETIVLSVYSFFVLLPDESLDRVVLITLPFIFIIRLEGMRMPVLWVATSIAAAANFTPFWGAPGYLPGASAFALLVGSYGSAMYVALTNLPTLLTPLLWLVDLAARRSASTRGQMNESRSPA